VKCIKRSLKLYQRVNKFTLYSFHQNGHPECEFDNFLTTYDTADNTENIHKIAAALREFAKRGVDKRRFRQKGEGSIDALLAGPDKLRLYMIPCSADSLIVGNGCFKDQQVLQDVPECKKAWELMVELDKELKTRLLDKSIYWQKNWDGNLSYRELKGDLNFELGNC
jgi:hypothetical protein